MSSRGIRAARAFVEIFADDSALKRTLKTVQTNLKTLAAGTAKVGGALTGAALGALAPLTAAVFSFAESGAALDDMSQRTGVSADQLSRLKYAAEQSGSTLESVEKGIRKLGQVVTAAGDGSKSAAESLAAVGVSAKGLESLTPDEQFLAIAEGLSKIEDPGERAARAMDIFGKAGAELVPLLSGEAQGIQNLMDKADELGIVIGSDQAKAAAEFDDAWHSLKTTLGGITTQIAAAVVPAITAMMGQLLPVVSRVVVWVRENAGLIRGLALAAVGVGVFGAALVGIGSTLAIVAAGLGALLSPIGLVVAAGSAMAVSLITAMGGVSSAVEYLQGLFPGLSGAALETFNAIKAALDAGDYKAAADVLWKSLRLAWLTGIDALNREWLVWKKAFLDTFASAMSTVRNLWTSTQDWLANQIAGAIAAIDPNISVEAVQETLKEDQQRRRQAADQAAEAEQRARDTEFERAFSAANSDLNAARAQWAEATQGAAQSSAAVGGSAEIAGNPEFRKLLESIQSGEIKQNIDKATKPSGGGQDVRTVSGASTLTALINREGDISRRQLRILQELRDLQQRQVDLTRRGPQVAII